MTFFSVLQMVFALAVTLGVFGLSVVALRRYGPDLVKKLQATQGPRRLKVVEFLPLDAKRKLVLVRRDNRDHLLVLGPAGETVVEAGIPVTDMAAENNIVELPAKDVKNA